jgi:hypothetical protein
VNQARALGLTRGPIYAELRVDSRGVLARSAMFELAARSVGRAVPARAAASRQQDPGRAGLGNALGQPAPAPGDEPAWPSGVFMLPVLDVHPRVAMQILRHSKIAVTMEIYTEVPSAATARPRQARPAARLEFLALTAALCCCTGNEKADPVFGIGL